MQYYSRCAVSFQYSFIFAAGTWSGPNDYSCPTLVIANDVLKPHLANATQLINNSLARNILKAYRTAWNSYCRFSASFLGAATDDFRHVLAFISYCHMQLALSHNTIRLYLAGVQLFCPYRTPGKP